ncbi:hypothetical protein CC78DRAFT_583079 [Lojkania enalia]|uniref:Uncharacterized protein n=1 Tax=Lojkania enalia TaxID=147567 RepID=A0A9P4K652_9PLEO|nr:hypothetical protein CC78DRAFT_583079 [Didymosphaeria enalia]
MSSSTRLYERLGQIPQDPSDPESLEDLVVCAFGAFERYYVYGYDLPQSLHEWLFPTDGSTRDFATLQVVFGRGDEYFASDKNGKLEQKEPEVKKPENLAEPSDKFEKPAFRRSRTISFMRPASDSAVKPPAVDTPAIGRPPSLSVSSQPSSRPQRISIARPTSDPLFNPPTNLIHEAQLRDSYIDSPTPVPARPKRRPLSMSFNHDTFPKIVEGKALTPSRGQAPPHCSCGCHTATPTKPRYADASMQTDPEPALRTALRIDTTMSSETSSLFSHAYDSSIPDTETPLSDAEMFSGPPPVVMGRMMDYFNNPGYRLGDSLSSMYSARQPVYYEDEYGYEADWDQVAMDKLQAV